MKQGWNYLKLGKVFPIVMGKTPSRDNNKLWDNKKETNNLWVSISDITKNEGKNILETKEQISDIATLKVPKVKKGSLLLSFKLSLGKMAFAGKDLYTNEAIIALPTNDKFDLKFLYYYFSTLDWSKITEGKEKVKGKTLNKPSLAEIPILDLPFPEQQSIVARLDSAFAKIDALKANAQKQLENAKDLFQNALKDAMTPKGGWEEKRLEEVCEKIVDCPHTTPKKSIKITQYPCIRTSELKNGLIRWDTMQYLDKDEYEKRTVRLKPQPNDIVYGREGTFGDAVLLPEGYFFSLGQRTMLFRSNSKIVIPQYLHFFVISPIVFDQAKKKNTGCGVPHVNVSDVKLFVISFPKSLDVQKSIVEKLDAISSRCRQLEENYTKTIALCDDMKQALLRETFE